MLREAHEELGIDAEPLRGDTDPVFLTWTRTVGQEQHVDVSLRFLLALASSDPVTWDRREFRSVRWWAPADVRTVDPARLDPHLPRLLDVLDTTGAWHR